VFSSSCPSFLFLPITDTFFFFLFFEQSGALVPIPHHGAYPPNTLTALARRNPNQNMDEVLGIGRGWPYVTARGTIALRMNGHIMVEMTCDQAIRLVNYQVEPTNNDKNCKNKYLLNE
jgi:hypothetical protein